MQKNNKTTSEKLDPDRPKIYLNEFHMHWFLFKDKEINKYDAAVYCLIETLNHPKYGCYASNKAMAEAIGVSAQYISNCIQKLIKKKFIINNDKNNHRRALYPTPPQKDNPAYNDRYKLPITNVIGLYNNTNNNNTNVFTNVNTNGRTSRSPKKVIKVSKCPIDCLEIWNELEYTPTHKTGTKIHANVNRYVNQLLNGTFSKYNSIHPSFLKDNNLSSTIGKRKYSLEQIEDGLRTMAKMFQEGMEPEDKSWLKNMNLASLIYNERSRKSQLLKFLHREVRPLNEVIEYNRSIEANPAWLSQIKHIINEEKLTPVQRVTLRKNIILIDKYYDWMWDCPLKRDQRLKSALPDENVFFDWYEKWLLQIPKVYPSRLGPKARDWNLFLNWLSQECLGSSTSLVDTDYEMSYLNEAGGDYG